MLIPRQVLCCHSTTYTTATSCTLHGFHMHFCCIISLFLYTALTACQNNLQEDHRTQCVPRGNIRVISHTRQSRFQASATQMRTALFWVIMQLVVVISYQCFRTTYKSHLQGSRRLSQKVRKKLPLLPAQ